jgi:hypothetical protein
VRLTAYPVEPELSREAEETLAILMPILDRELCMAMQEGNSARGIRERNAAREKIKEVSNRKK